MIKKTLKNQDSPHNNFGALIVCGFTLDRPRLKRAFLSLLSPPMVIAACMHILRTLRQFRSRSIHLLPLYKLLYHPLLYEPLAHPFYTSTNCVPLLSHKVLQQQLLHHLTNHNRSTTASAQLYCLLFALFFSCIHETHNRSSKQTYIYLSPAKTN